MIDLTHAMGHSLDLRNFSASYCQSLHGAQKALIIGLELQTKATGPTFRVRLKAGHGLSLTLVTSSFTESSHVGLRLTFWLALP